MLLRFRSLAVCGLVSLGALVCACKADKPRGAIAAEKPSALSAAPATPGAGVCGMEDEKKPAEPACAAPPARENVCRHGMHDQGNPDEPIVPVSRARVGDRTRCPVTQQVFVVNAASPRTVFDGKTYTFCCDGCVERFLQSPRSFIDS